jgi:hypothetical protein
MDEADKVRMIELKQAVTTLKALMALSDETIEKSACALSCWRPCTC